MNFQLQSLPTFQKRQRDDQEEDRPRDEKRSRVCYDNAGGIYMVQREEDVMAMGVDDVEMESEMDCCDQDDASSQWNLHAPRMSHQISTTSLSSSFTSSSSSPPTPSDIFSSFTDSNGVSRHFLNHNNQPLSMYPPTPEKDVKVEFIEDDATAFARYVYMNKTKGTISVEGVQNDGLVRQLELPVYGWDQPPESKPFHLGGHLI